MLQYILNDQGRARPVIPDGGTGQTKFVYDYFLKDYLKYVLGGGWTTMPKGVHIEEHDFILTFVDNQSIGKDVWFDNIHVEHYTGKVLEQNHYYPFGLTIAQDGAATSTEQPYKYNGKELVKSFGLENYDYGARIFDPQIGRWKGVDPLAEKYYQISPFAYVANNPSNLIDPTGMSAESPTDFVDINSGEITTIDDGIDQTIALDGPSINSMQETFNSDKDAYSDRLGKLSNSELNLGMKRSEFMFFAETLYAESYGGFLESLGIVNVLENRAENEGTSVKDQLSALPPYGVYGVWKTSSGKNSKYKFSYINERGAYGAEKKRNNIHRAIAVGLTTTEDVSNGAFFWEGADITTNSHYKSWGLKFSSPSHNLWGLKETSGSAQLITTGAIGKTTFSKFLNQGKKWFISN